MTTTGDPRHSELTEVVDRADDGRFAGDEHGVSCDCCIRGYGETEHDMGFTSGSDTAAGLDGDTTELIDRPEFAAEAEFASDPEFVSDPDVAAGTEASAEPIDQTIELDTSLADLPGGRFSLTRRRFIQGLAAAGAVGYVVVREAKPVERSGVESQVASRSASTGAEVAAPVVDQLQAAPPSPDAVEQLATINANLLLPAPVDQRVLVLVDFAGGNDGLSTVVPYASSTYYDQRPNLAIAQEEVLQLDSEVGLAPALGRLHQRQLATVEGVGPIDGSLSHFEMVDRWAQGDMLGQGGQRAGFLARLSDRVDVGGAVTGLSVAGHTPRLEASQSSTLSLSNLNQLRVLTDDEWIYPRYRAAVRSFGGGPMSTAISSSWNALFAVGDSMSSDIDRVDGNSQMVREGGGLGRQLAMAAEMIKADVGVRVIHAQIGGFDTHEGHNGRHNNLMGQFDAAVDGFLQEIELAGMADRVLVATTSEFGRRVSQNGSGLDHGAASAMLLVGPIRSGRLGEPSPVDDTDGQGNLKTTVAFDRYLAALAQEWLGIEAGAVLPNSPQPIGLF